MTPTDETFLPLFPAQDRDAYDRAFTEAYRQLTEMARAVRVRLEGGSLNTTGLVHECYLRLSRSHGEVRDPAHLLAIAARAMRHLLIERARARVADKRGGGGTHVGLDALQLAEQRDAIELIEIDDLLRALAQREPEQAAIVECRLFGGLSDSETSAALDVPLRTVQRQWARARDWMLTQ